MEGKQAAEKEAEEREALRVTEGGGFWSTVGDINLQRRKEHIFPWNCKNGNGRKKVVCVCKENLGTLSPVVSITQEEGHFQGWRIEKEDRNWRAMFLYLLWTLEAWNKVELTGYWNRWRDHGLVETPVSRPEVQAPCSSHSTNPGQTHLTWVSSLV